MTGRNELNMSAFEKAMQAAAGKIDLVCADLQRAAAIDGFARIVRKSPVHFMRGGSFRGRWLIGLNAQPSDPGPMQPDASGMKAIAKAKAALGMMAPYGTVWITNHSPQANIIEYGGYPNPVKYGTYVPKSYANKLSDRAKILSRTSKPNRRGRTRATHVQLSYVGFSRQAPAGVVRVTIEELIAAWNQIAANVLQRHRLL